MNKQELPESASVDQFKLPEKIDAEMSELIADAMAFRALAEIPSLWQLTIMFGPYFKLDIAWGAGQNIKVVQNGHIMVNRKAALRLLIHDAQTEIKSRSE
jgi:hypothetical protein